MKTSKQIALSSGFLVLITVLFTFFSCEKDGQGGWPKPKPKPVDPCATYGTFTKVICGRGAFGAYWIMPDNTKGHFLQPCEFDRDLGKMLPYIQDGTRIKFAYKTLSGRCACDTMITCMAEDTRIKSKERVSITCLQFLNEPVACLYSGTVKYSESCRVRYIQRTDGGTYEPVDQSTLKAFAINDQVEFNYNEVYTTKPVCLGMPVELTCISRKKGTDCRPLTIGSDPSVPPGISGIKIIDAEVEGNCLRLKMGYSGCNVHTDKIDLMWDGAFLKSLPAQANLSLHDRTPQMCAAYFQEETSYDLSVLKKDNPNMSLKINLAGWGVINY